MIGHREDLFVPETTAHALDPEWLGKALAPVTGGQPITAVEVVETICTKATKIRFTAAFDGARGGKEAFCLKGFLDVDEATARGGVINVLEADFYRKIAPQLTIRVPDCAATVVDRENPKAVLILRDLIDQGARFNSALDAFTPDETAQSLEQLARLHAGGLDAADYPWARRRVEALANATYITTEQLQDLLDGPRGEGFSSRTTNAQTLRQAMHALAARDRETPDFLIHGDAHAGNSFRTSDGPGLIDWQLLQTGGWALDVAYHIAAVLPVDLAERSERDLLAHYLDFARSLGGGMPDDEEAWRQYREAAVYGYWLWAITRSGDPQVTQVFNQRLGASVTRHDSYALLGL